jgi:2-polyprenyl-3-methyl-5-hydroxy-6-metoxy-1,4-benzoquinol methylase
VSTLTKKEDWDQGYASRKEIVDLNFGWRDHTNYLIVKKIEEIGLDGKSVLEIGAGDSPWLPYFARKHPGSRFAGLDYSKAGCERLAERAAAICQATTIDIYHQDMFAMESALHGRFDLVLSFGVVEHFTELSHALLAQREYLKDKGLMFSLIPNMAGSIGYLTKLFNRKIYEMHNPHDWHSFFDGHRGAGLTVISGGYLGSINFGVLSSCFEKQEGFSWHTYVFLTRLTKALWLVESKLGDLPRGRIFSPYIYAISRAN